jgi:hypothetical protein
MVLVDSLEFLEWALRFEDGVEMADQKEMRARTIALCDQMPSAAELSALNPARCQPDVAKLAREDFSDRFDALEVERAAVVVDAALEQFERSRAARVDVLDDCSFDGIQGGRRAHKYDE